jgi:3-hydroxyacyl-CoA dehydrogenase
MLDRQGFDGELVVTQDLDRALDGADFVLEAVPEKLELKHEVFPRRHAVSSRSTSVGSAAGG